MKSKQYFLAFLMSIFLLLGLQTGSALADKTPLPSEGGTLTDGTYVVQESMTVTGPFTIDGNVTIEIGKDCVLDYCNTQCKRLFSFTFKSSLTIEGPSATARGTIKNSSENLPVSGGFAYLELATGNAGDNSITLTNINVEDFKVSSSNEDEAVFGLLYNSGTAKITNCSFTGCQTYSEFGPAYGGAIHSSNGSLTIEGTTFEGCKAANNGNPDCYGGAISFWNGEDGISLKDCTFKECEATAKSSVAYGIAKGGAVYLSNDEKSVEIENLTFTDCTASSGNSTCYGGALFLSGGTVNITKGTFTGCNATNGNGVGTNIHSYGGAICITSGTKVVMKESSIEKCSAQSTNDSLGGAVYICETYDQDTEAGTFEMTDSTITDCTADIIADKDKSQLSGTAQGGAVYTGYQSTFTMTGGSISGCKATGNQGYGISGGAVYNNAGSVTITGAKIEKCEANDEGGNSAYGGAIHSDSLYAKLILDNCTISDCKAVETGYGTAYGTASAGAVDNARGYMRINECTITNCNAQAGKEARGGVLFNTGKMEMKNTDISGCSALGYENGGIGYGGAVYNYLNDPSTGYFAIDGGSITECSADYGGGIANVVGDITISGSITGCTASVIGGGYYRVPNNDYSAALVIAGEANIAGNTVNGKESNVVSDDTLKLFGEPVLVGGTDESEEFNIAFEPLSEEACIGVTMNNGDIILNADETKKSDAATLLAVFSSDNPDYAVSYEEDKTLRLVKKPTADIATAPEAIDNIYTGEPLPLVTEGTSEDGELVYRLADEEEQYSSEIPVGTEAGIYKIYYGIIGDKNHKDNYDFEPIDAVIYAADAEYDELKGKQNLVYTGDAQELLTVNATGVTFAFRLAEDEDYSTEIPTGIEAGTYPIEWIVDEVDPNYIYWGEESGTLTAIIKKAEQAAPEICNIGFKEDGKSGYIAYIEEVENGLYSFDGMKTFSTNNQLEGVAPGEKVTGYVKYAGDDNHFESPAVKGSATAPESDPTPVPEDEEESSNSRYTPEYPLYIEPGGSNGGGSSGTAKNDKDEETEEETAEAAENENETDDSINIMLTIDSNIATVNGEEVELDAPAVIMNDRTMLPIRFIAENLGADVQWLEETRTVVITMDDTVIVLTIDSNIATVNGEAVELDAPAVIMNDRTMLPIRFVAENLGATVEWDGEARTVAITK